MGIIGGIASAIIGKKSADKASKQASQGFNYLKGNSLVQNTQQGGSVAGDRINALLGLGGDVGAANRAFADYQGSTGYQFRFDQGADAVTQNAAARGLLNSGATLKGLTEYGQNFASNEFQNYLAALGGAQATGLSAAYNVASQGASAGAQSAQYTRQGASDMTAGLGSALGGLSNWMTRPTADNSRPFYTY